MIQMLPYRNGSLSASRTRLRAIAISWAALLLFTMSVINSPRLAADVDADNTKRNQRNDSALTPLDQSNDPADIKLVASIRNAITDDGALSVNAQNLKVIVRQGTATLRGPVENASEKARVEQLAKNTKGVVRVDSQISVKHQ